MKYTYSDDEDEGYSDATTRRSTRNTGTHTPAEPVGPTVTLSGRQVRSRHGGVYGESMLSGTHTPALTVGDHDGAAGEAGGDEVARGGRPRRATTVRGHNNNSAKGRHIEEYNSVDEMDDEDEDDASEQDYGDDEEDDHVSLESDIEDEEDELSNDDVMEDELEETDRPKKSLVIKLTVKTPTPEKENAHKPDLIQEIKGSQRTMSRSNGVEDRKASGHVDQAPQSVPESVADSIIGVKSTEPISIASQSDIGHPFPSPLSPSLAYRGSPEKPHAFSHPINVRQGEA